MVLKNTHKILVFIVIFIFFIYCHFHFSCNPKPIYRRRDNEMIRGVSPQTDLRLGGLFLLEVKLRGLIPLEVKSPSPIFPIFSLEFLLVWTFPKFCCRLRHVSCLNIHIRTDFDKMELSSCQSKDSQYQRIRGWQDFFPSGLAVERHPNLAI